jgi:RNA-directed DNA polymerase
MAKAGDRSGAGREPCASSNLTALVLRPLTARFSTTTPWLGQRMNRLPLLLYFDSIEQYLRALESDGDRERGGRVRRLHSLGLPPIENVQDLATLFGYSPSFLMSMAKRPNRYYRTFQIPKGTTTRTIKAPRVALKLMQRWVCDTISESQPVADHVHGFVRGRSTITAAQAHIGAHWALSLDIRDFFGSVSRDAVFATYLRIGLSRAASHILTDLTTLDGCLPQGSPASPVLANLAFSEADLLLEQIAENRKLRLTRYADDITFSGTESDGEHGGLEDTVTAALRRVGWTLAQQKTTLHERPGAIRLLGLVVSKRDVRLPKQSRNRLRMIRRQISTNMVPIERIAEYRGWIAYANAVEAANQSRGA